MEIYIREFLNFCQVEDLKMETIGRKVEMSLSDWLIDSMLTLTADNTSSNSGNIRFLQTVTKDDNVIVLEYGF